MSPAPSVFTRILSGDLPGQVIYRDNIAASLLTIQPFTPGHMLVVPLEQVDHLWDLDGATYDHVMGIARLMAKTIRAAYPEYRRIGMAVEGFEVPHAHVHVFGMDAGFQHTLPAPGEEQPFADPDELVRVAHSLRTYLAS